jgi:hypothetical protein
MNKQIAALSAFFLMLLVFSIVGNVFAQTQAVPGVSVGDKFIYANTYSWNSTNAADVVPAYLVAQNQSTLQVTVQQVTGSTAILEKVWTYKNGTQQTDTETDEVNGGITGTVLLYAANLSAGGLLFPGSTSLTYAINDSSFRTYSGSFRETNHIQVNNTGDENLAYSFINLFFDKQTGVLVEYFLTDVSTASPNQMVTQHLVITESTLWTIPEFPPTIILPLILIASTLTLLVINKKRHKSSQSTNYTLKP